MYTVKQVAALTGVAESTLRAWERRYAVVRPERSAGGYRLYTDAHVARLREMVALTEAGVPASRAAETVQAASDAAPGGDASGPFPEAPVPPRAWWDDDLVDAARSLDPGQLDAAIEKAFTAAPFEEVADAWLLPVLGRLGAAWEAGRLSVAQEHFASSGLMRALSAVFDAAVEEPDAPGVLVGLPAGERHELALLAFAACLRRRGLRVVYLGADIPSDAWGRAATEPRIRAAVIGVNTPRSVAEAQRVADVLGTLSPPLAVWVGGSRQQAVTGVHHLPDAVAEAAATLHRGLLAGRV